MRVTVVKEDGIVGVDGEFRAVDLSGMPPEVRIYQWEDTEGHVEYYETANTDLESIDELQAYIDLWIAAAPPPPVPLTPEEIKQIAQWRIMAAYANAVSQLTGGYPLDEMLSWYKQEAEARAWVADNLVATPWIDAAATARGIPKANMVAFIIGNADAFAPLHGALTGKRQLLRDQIEALGEFATQEQADALVW